MGAPSQRQIDEAIAHGLASGLSEDEIAEEVMGLSRMSDEELGEVGVFPHESPTPNPIRGTTAASDVLPIPFTPAPIRHRHDGWTAERQRAFIAALAETGCVSEACAEVGITARSAYRLREHPVGAAFRSAWDHAQSIATVRLTAIAWERAVHGTPDRIYKDGKLIAERRKPSDKLLMWLLAHHNPVGYGWAAKPPGHAPDGSFFPVQHARNELPDTLAGIADVCPVDCPAEAVPYGDYHDADDAPGA